MKNVALRLANVVCCLMTLLDEDKNVLGDVDETKGDYGYPHAAGHGMGSRKEESEHSFADYLIDNYKNSQFDLDQIDEKEMSPAQQKKKEEIVLSMKDKTKEFKAKYGKRWKDVMYATATKMAMKEETLDERYDDDEDDDVARADRELARMKAKPIKPHEKTDPDKEISKLAKATRCIGKSNSLWRNWSGRPACGRTGSRTTQTSAPSRRCSTPREKVSPRRLAPGMPSAPRP